MNASAINYRCCSMDDYFIHRMSSFHDELEKYAANPTTWLSQVIPLLRRQAGATGAGVGLGAAGGGLIGGGVQGVRGYQQARQEGATRGQALASGLGKGVGGAAAGAALGAGVGGAAGLTGGRHARELAERAVQGGAWNPLASSARFGQRQLHSLTGYADARTEKGLKALHGMRAGSYAAQQRADSARQALGNLWGQGADPKKVRKAAIELQKAQQGLQASQAAERMGLTSLPGYLKSLATNPLATLRTGAMEQWRGSGLGGKAMFVGLPTAAAAGELASPAQEGGPGKLERVGRSLAGGLAFGAAPIPLAGMGILATGAERLGGLAGAGGDVMLARRRAQQEIA